jgi:hypothetical protein
MARPTTDGATDRAHLEAAARMGNARAIASLRGPVLPSAGVFAWVVFCDLDRWRGAGGFGMTPLTLHDLAAYEARHDVRIDAETVELVKALDHERLAAAQPKTTPKE